MSKTILVTGSSSGIGAAIIEYFANRGYNTIITYKQGKDKAYKLQDNLDSKGKHIAVELDVTSEESVKKCTELISNEYGKLDIVVCNAGVDFFSQIEDLDYEGWRNIVGTKLDGSFLCTKYFYPLLAKNEKSNIFYLSSSLSIKPDWRDPAYSAASAAVTNFGQSMAVALAKYGIRSNTICPGPTKTNMKFWEQLENVDKEIWNKMSNTNPLKRNTDFNDISETIEKISSDSLNYLNGNVIYVNGGSHLI